MILKNKRVLVVGGAGFIGSHIVAEMVNRDCEVLTINHTSSLYSVLRKKTVEQKIDVDVVYYEALCPSLINNVRGITNVLEAMKNKSPHTVLVFASSGSVYGNSVCTPQTELCPCNPTTINGLAKLLAEQIIKFYTLNYGLKTVVLRYYNPVGKGQKSGFLFDIIHSVLSGSPPIIYGDVQQKRCLTSVNDVVDANVLAYENPAAYGQVFNIAGSEIATIEEIATMACELSPFKGLKPKYDRDRIDCPAYNFVPSIDKARNLLGYSPKVKLKDMITMLLQEGQGQ